jgi:hypothetical protein
MQKWSKVAIFLVALGILFYIVNLVVFIPRWYILQEASWEAFHAHTTIPNPADFGIDQNYWITVTILSLVSEASLIIGGGFLIIQLIIRIIRQLGK